MQPEVSDQDFVPTIERICDDIAARMQEVTRQLEALVQEQLALRQAERKILADLLRHVGIPAVCRGPQCRQDILLVYHKATTGSLTPYNLDGTSHFTTCVDRELFRKGKKNA